MNKSETSIAGGFSNGEQIIIPKTKTSAEILMVLFHELGHNIDTQFDIRQVLLPTNEILSLTIDISNEEAQWLQEESQSGWSGQGITEKHRSLTKKLLKAILKPDTHIKSDIREMGTEDFNETMRHAKVLGSEKNNDSNELIIVDKRIHRNSEVPADFIMELMFDVLNRSINNKFNLPGETRIFKVNPDERNIKTTDIARFLIKKGWQSPSFNFKRNNQET
ncbi:MAG: hypothetical protein GW941_00685 [Candidatus Pacebacteria bacterium]|nr:hypothetical protein [Candidatus Paceibacterota bacterium]